MAIGKNERQKERSITLVGNDLAEEYKKGMLHTGDAILGKSVRTVKIRTIISHVSNPTPGNGVVEGKFLLSGRLKIQGIGSMRL